MKHIRLTLFLLFLSVITFGQETMTLSLSEAVDYALQNNKSLQKERLNLNIAESKIKEAKAQGLPQIDGGIDWMTYFGYELEFNFGGGDDITEAQILAAQQEILSSFTGIPGYASAVTNQDFYAYGAMQAFEQKLMPSSSAIPMNDVLTAKIQLGQLLFSGQYLVGLQTAKLGQTIAEKGYDNAALDIKEAVTSSYFMALVTQQSIGIFEKTIDNLNQIKGHTQKMYDAGMAEQTDVDQISMQVVMLENNLRSMQRGLKMVYNMMKFQLGVDVNSNIDLKEDLSMVIASINPNGDVITNELNNNLLYQLIETQESISEKMVAMEKWSYAPTVSGFFALNGKLIKPEFDMNPPIVAGASMSVPIFSSGARKEKLAQAKIQLDQARLQKAMVEDQLKLQESQLTSDLETAKENFNAQKENVEVAKRTFENIKNKFEQGMVSSLDLTQANSNYLTAETNFIQSTMALLQAKIALDKLYNQL